MECPSELRDSCIRQRGGTAPETVQLCLRSGAAAGLRNVTVPAAEEASMQRTIASGNAICAVDVASGASHHRGAGNIARPSVWLQNSGCRSHRLSSMFRVSQPGLAGTTSCDCLCRRPVSAAPAVRVCVVTKECRAARNSLHGALVTETPDLSGKFSIQRISCEIDAQRLGERSTSRNPGST